MIKICLEEDVLQVNLSIKTITVHRNKKNMSNCTFKMQPVNLKCTAISPSLLTYQYWYMNDKLVSVDNISSSNLSFSSGLFPSPLYLSVTFHFIVGAVVFFCFFWLLAFQIRLFNLLHDWVCLFCLVMQWVYLYLFWPEWNLLFEKFHK